MNREENENFNYAPYPNEFQYVDLVLTILLQQQYTIHMT